MPDTAIPCIAENSSPNDGGWNPGAAILPAAARPPALVAPAVPAPAPTVGPELLDVADNPDTTNAKAANPKVAYFTDDKLVDFPLVMLD